jgi:DinB superfamily
MMVALDGASELDPELARVKQEFLDARERARGVAGDVGASLWAVRPAPERWSVAECLIHLNITSERFMPMIDAATRDLRDRGLLASGRLRRDLMGWLLCRVLEPPYRLKVKTEPSFVPRKVEPMDEVLERFDSLQGELLVRLDRATGLALDRAKVASPFNARVKYNLYSVFCLIPAHQRRHLFQANRVREELVGRPVPTA